MANFQITPEQVRALELSELITLYRDATEELDRLQTLLAFALKRLAESSEGHSGQD